MSVKIVLTTGYRNKTYCGQKLDLHLEGCSLVEL